MITQIIVGGGILRLEPLNGVSLQVLKPFRILAGNGVKRQTVRQDPKSLKVAGWFVHSLDQYIPHSCTLQHWIEWVAGPNGINIKGGNISGLVLKSGFEMVLMSQKKAHTVSGPYSFYTVGE